MSYESSKGGIAWKSDVGTLLYDYPGKPYAVSGIDTSGVGLVFPEYAQEISYTSFESVDSISENGIVAKFLYNSDNERARMEVRQGGNTILTRWYPSGSYIKETAGGVTKEYTFIGGDAYSAPVVAVKTNGGEPVYYYLLRDYLGSITHVVDATGNSVVAEYSYDAWGRMRNPSTWENYPPGSEPAPFIAGRGYTGHEHLPWFSFINMLSEGPDDVLKSGGAKSRNPGLPGAAGNGRVYDPLTGQFLSPDNYIQAPDFTQSFNRYGYCLNNPLKYTDPDGEWFLIDDAIAAVVGGVINLATNWKNIDNFWEGLGSFGAGAANGWLTLNLGPVGAAIGGGITGAANNIIAQTGNGVGLKQVDWGKVGFNGLVGSASGIAGYGAGQWAANNLGGVVINGFNITHPILKTTISGTIGGAVGGYVGGYTSGYLLSGDPSVAHEAGMRGLQLGAGIGAVTGFAGGLKYCRDNKINPLTGKPKRSVTIGEGQDRVNRYATDLNSNTISNDWNEYLGPGRVSDDLAFSFNDYWITKAIVNDYYIFDLGPIGKNSTFYNIEQNNIHYFNYEYKVYHVRIIKIQQIRVLIIRK